MRSRLETVLWASGAAGLAYSLYDKQWPLVGLTLTVLLLLAVTSLLRRWILASPTLWDWSLRTRHAGDGVLAHVAGRLWGANEDTKKGYDSIEWSREHGGARRNHALVAPLKTISRRRKWPGWAFAIGLTSEGLDVERAPSTAGVGTVRVSLGANPTGIYNNAGKRFLDYDQPLNEETDPEAHKKALLLSELAHSTFLAPDEEPLSTPLAKGFSLRWASAGVLPIARRRGREWVVVFFRDIRPKGWNLANGASESDSERHDLAQLAHREFCEEVIVIEGEPSRGVRRRVRPFSFDGAFGRLDVLESRAFASEQSELRYSEDRLRLEWPAEPRDHFIEVRCLRTRWRVAVAGRGGSETITRNVIPSLNPLERGVEITQLLQFDLADSDQILDGEILEDVGGRRILARRPVGLISLDFIRRVILDSSWEDASRDRRLLPPIPKDDIHVFSAEGLLRKSRLEALEKQRGSGDTPSAEELHHREWSKEFSGIFEPEVGQLEQARLLCPVVWKTLEVAVKTGVL